MTNEQLQPSEIPKETESPATGQSENFDDTQISETFSQRHHDLETIKQWIGLKFYYRAAEKVKQEEAALRKLLDREEIKRSILSEYSFVLDPLYFEQKFLKLP